MTTLYSFQKPYKVWSCDREARKSVVASSLLELKLRAAEKLAYDTNSNISELRVVLEEDGTEIEDDSYFQTAEQDTVFLLLRASEKWSSPGVEALKAAIKAVPGIVCDALNKMELVDKPPSWKIMDNRGNVTVVLNWDRDRLASGLRKPGQQGDWHVEVHSSQERDELLAQEPVIISARSAAEGLVRTSSSKSPSPQPPTRSSTRSPSPHLGAAAAARARLSLDGLSARTASQSLASATQRVTFLPRNGEVDLEFDSDEDESDEKTAGEKSAGHDHSQCDFHCAALHRGAAQLQVTKSVATSPIQETVIVPALSMSSDLYSATGSTPKKGAKYVRFSDIEAAKAAAAANGSDSEETETTDEQLCERYLLLVDQLSAEQQRHLNIKDIGSILERLSTKVVDVEKLEREKETEDCYNWVIKGTVKGDLREIGVIYNGQYYGITEHPGYF